MRRSQKRTFDKKLGVKLVSLKKGYCKVKLIIKKEHLNSEGIVHGGVIASLCDIVLAASLYKSLKKDERCVTVHLSIDFTERAYGGETIFGVSKLIRRGKTLAFMEGYIESKDKRKIARANGIWFIKHLRS